MRRVRLGHNSGTGFVEDESLSLSERGYDFQDRWTLALLRRFKGFATVTFTDAQGNVVTEENYRRRGPDGGIDLRIDIRAQDTALHAMQARVRNIILALEIDESG